MLPALHLRLGPAPPACVDEPTGGCIVNVERRIKQIDTELGTVQARYNMAQIGWREYLDKRGKLEAELRSLQLQLHLKLHNRNDCRAKVPTSGLFGSPSVQELAKKYVSLPDRSSGLAAIQVDAVGLIKAKIRKEKGLGPGAELSDDDYEEANARFWKAVEEARHAKSRRRSR